jgi:hypothetical protein
VLAVSGLIGPVTMLRDQALQPDAIRSNAQGQPLLEAERVAEMPQDQGGKNNKTNSRGSGNAFYPSVMS